MAGMMEQELRPVHEAGRTCCADPMNVVQSSV